MKKAFLTSVRQATDGQHQRIRRSVIRDKATDSTERDPMTMSGLGGTRPLHTAKTPVTSHSCWELDLAGSFVPDIA